MPSASKIIRSAAAELTAAGVEDAAREAELLLMHVAGVTREALYASDPQIGPEAERSMARAVERRVLREPMQYIIGSVEFLGLTIGVGPGVLVPRPETEMMALEARRIIGGAVTAPRALDVCTGSGCLALAIAAAHPAISVDAVDISVDALAYARRNAEANGIANVSFHQGDLYAPVSGRSYGLIVSNPPYIASAEIDTLQPEVSAHEPRAALDGGADGLDFYRRIVAGALGHLAQGGALVLELGMGQYTEVSRMAREAGLADVRAMRDLAGIERVLMAWRK